jgi:hypothetical protein
MGNDDHRTGLIFCFFSIKGKEEETNIGNVSVDADRGLG